MKKNVVRFIIIFIFLMISSCNKINSNSKTIETGDLMIRIAEIEIEPEFLEDYLAILKEESEASVRLEPGVICIYPMYETENPAEIRLLEIYASKEAYKAHLQTTHFKHYKTTTLPMVKSLQLIDMQTIDPESMINLFVKLNIN